MVTLQGLSLKLQHSSNMEVDKMDTLTNIHWQHAEDQNDIDILFATSRYSMLLYTLKQILNAESDLRTSIEDELDTLKDKLRELVLFRHRDTLIDNIKKEFLVRHYGGES